MAKIKTRRWTDKDDSVYFCEACERYHYLYSEIGRRHKKFAREKKKQPPKYEFRIHEIDEPVIDEEF